ncbi:trypsin-like peptidase domain-containing protein, partial [Traorella massiliensis]
MDDENIVETEVHETEIKEEKKEKKNKSKVIWIFICALVGFVSGIGGTFLTLQLSGGISSNTDVIYQSVVQTNEDGEAVDEMSTVDVVENVKDSIVEITTSKTETTVFLQQYVTSGAGSGVVFSDAGLIVTNHHVIDGADEIKVRLTNGDEYDAELIASDAQSDLAVLRIDAENLTPVVLGDSDTLNVGESVIAIGNPLGSLGGTVTEGILSA